MRTQRLYSMKGEQRKDTWSPLSKKQKNYLSKKITQKFNDLTQSFLLSRGQTSVLVQKARPYTVQGTRQNKKQSTRPKTTSSMLHYSTSRQESLTSPIPKKTSTSFSRNNSRLDHCDKDNFMMSIPLKSVPKISSRKSSFGWISPHEKQLHKEEINIHKMGRSYSIILKKNKNEWKETLSNLKKDFESIEQKLMILPRQVWGYLIGKFQNFYLDINEKEQLIELFCKFLECNFDSSETNYLDFIGACFGIMSKKNQFDFCDQLGTKFQKMQNRIYFKHKYCLQYAKFMVSNNLHRERFYPIYFTEFQFNLNEKEVFDLFAMVRQFCQNNMDAFAFITLYFQIGIKKLLKIQSFKTVEEHYVRALDQISKTYPPSLEGIIESRLNFDIQSIQTSHKFQKLLFVEGRSHYEQLEEFILKKAEQAKEQQTLFRCLVEDICFKYGYSFKSGVKIKSAKHKACIFRTIEKLMTKKQFKAELSKFKKSMAQKNSQNNNISERIQLEIQQAQQAISQIIERQKYIQFDAKDLVRGKCTFSKVQQILQTVNLLQEHLQKQGFKVIEVKNRLKKGTKDVSLIIKLNKSIAELQLALKLDSVTNEFNHKIFQLTRSHIHSPLINLFIHSERWGETFFTEQCQLFDQIHSSVRQPDLRDSVNFKQLKRDIDLFKKNFLDPNEIRYEKTFKSKQQEKVKLSDKIKEIKKYSAHLKPKNAHTDPFQITQRQNLINFYKSFDYKMGLETIELIDEEQIMKRHRLLKLKGQILKLDEKYKDSLECFETYIQLYYQNKKDSLQLADVYHSIGSIYDVQQNFSYAIQYYQKSLQIKESILGEKSLEVATSLNGIGEVLSNMKTKEAYEQALQYHFKALQIRKEILGKQSMDTATSLNNIGAVYRRQAIYQSSLDFLKQSLQLRQKIIGKQSLDAATSLYNIGVLFHCKDQPKKALEYLNKSIEIREKILGKESIDIAKGHLYISYALEKLGELQKAQDSISMAYQIFKKVLGQEHENTKLSYEQYSDIRTKLERKLKLSFTGFNVYKNRSVVQSLSSGEYQKPTILN